MRNLATPLFAGDFYDTAQRLALAQPASAADATAAWQHMLDLGWPSVLIEERHGGAGATLADFAAIVEAIATRALNVPLIERCAVAPALLAAGHGTVAGVLLERIAAGDASAAPALHAAAQHAAARRPRLRGGCLSGTVSGVDWTVPPSHVVFDAFLGDADEPALLLIDAAGLAPARLRSYVGVDGRTSVDLDVEGLGTGDAQTLLHGDRAADAVNRAQQLGSVLGCVATVGACGAMVDHTIEHLGTRVQFGAALATFQALRHRVVDMYVAYENARGLVRDLVLAHAHAPDARQVAQTRLYVQGVGRSLAEATIQLHGGMGMSQETLAARLALHALMTALRYGDRGDCLEWLVSDLVAEETAA